MCYTGVEFQIERQNISRRRSRSSKYAKLSHFTLCLPRASLSHGGVIIVLERVNKGDVTIPSQGGKICNWRVKWKIHCSYGLVLVYVPCLLVSFNPLISFCFARKRQGNNSKTAFILQAQP